MSSAHQEPEQHRTIHDFEGDDQHHHFISEPKRTPLPLVPLFIVFLIQFAEPVTGTVIYPFINKFVRATGITGGDERKTGYYAGIIQSLFFVTEAVTVFHWGWASDRIGRKPILLFGPVGLCLAMLSFGLSNDFLGLIISRCLQGVFNGNIGISKTVIAEVTDSTNIADAFALIPVVYGVGSTIGPIIGGVLSEPASRWPMVFGQLGIFVHHPYFFPCAVAGLIAFMSVPIASIGLKETAPAVVSRQKQARSVTADVPQHTETPTTRLINRGSGSSSYGTMAVARSEENVEAGLALPSLPDKPTPSGRVLSPRILLVYGFITFSDMCVFVLQPLVWSTSISLGGLGFDPYRIGLILGIWGFLNATFQMTFLGPIIRKFGPRKVIFTSFVGYIIGFLLYPVLSFSVRSAGRIDSKVWIVLLVQLLVAMSGYAAYAGMSVIIVNATAKESLGAANGIAQAVGSGLRGVAPTVASSLFSISLERRLLGGDFVFYLLAGIALIGLWLVPMLPE